MIPGNSAAMKMGGFVKMNIVETFNPLGSLDRFVAGRNRQRHEIHPVAAGRQTRERE